VHHRVVPVLAAVVAATGILLSCYAMRGSEGGGETSFNSPREIVTGDIALPDGYRIEAVATGFTFPTGVAFDADGVPHVIEAGYSYGEVWAAPRLLRVDRAGSVQDGSVTVVVEGQKNGPWTGIAWHDDAFVVVEGGEMDGGRVLRIRPDGSMTTLIDELPTVGDHHANGPAIAPDGSILIGIGTATNSAIVGEDNAEFGWLARHPDFHDVPCEDVTLTGLNFGTKKDGKTIETGAFSSYGTPSTAGQVIRGSVPCSGSIIKLPPAGGAPELVAWGFRNPFGLAFAPDGVLYATDNGYDERGSRPVWGTGDHLWRIVPGAWYGWPDYSGGIALTSHAFKLSGEHDDRLLLSKAPRTPEKPVATLGVHASADGFDFSRNEAFGHVGDAFIAEFGDMAPGAGKVIRPVGFKVVRVNVKTGEIEDFAVNKGSRNGPGSAIGTHGLERPVAVRFDPEGTALYVVDFGVMTTGDDGPKPRMETGVLWKITREAGR